MTRLGKQRIGVGLLGLLLFVVAFVLPAPADDQEFGRSVVGMVIIPLMLTVSLLCFVFLAVMKWGETLVSLLFLGAIVATSWGEKTLNRVFDLCFERRGR